MWRDVKNIALVSVVVFIFILDRGLKLWFQKFSPEGEFLVWGDFIKFKLAMNYGIAFGLPVNFYFLMVVYAVVLVVLVYWLVLAYQRQDRAVVLLLIVILVGAGSNLLDRLYVGGVIDYIDIKYYSVLNLADVMIVFGVVGLIWRNLVGVDNRRLS